MMIQPLGWFLNEVEVHVDADNRGWEKRIDKHLQLGSLIYLDLLDTPEVQSTKQSGWSLG